MTPTVRWATLAVALTACLLVFALIGCGVELITDYDEIGSYRVDDYPRRPNLDVADLPDGDVHDRTTKANGM